VANGLQQGAAGTRARRILRRQVGKGLRELDGGHRASDANIHDARKRIKRARAILRLMRAMLSRAEYRREDRLLRAAARPLGAARDAKILLEAFDGLQQRSRQLRRIKGGRRLRRALVRARSDARRRALTDASGARRALRLMHESRRRAKHWPLRHAQWRQLANGAVRCYAKGRLALREVRRDRSARRLHHWRKQAKYLYLQLELLAPRCPPSVATLAQRLHQLSDDLGTDHDLAMLHDVVAAYMRDFPHDVDAAGLLTEIEHSRSHLQNTALLRGRQLYRASPARLAGTLDV
jgi:CHAD domain-containing protein